MRNRIDASPRDYFDAAEAADEAASAAAEAAGAGAGAGAAAGAGAGAGAGASVLPQADRAAAATRVARTSDFFISGSLWEKTGRKNDFRKLS